MYKLRVSTSNVYLLFLIAVSLATAIPSLTRAQVLPDLETTFQIKHGSASIPYDGTLSFGSTPLGHPILRRVTIRNTGAMILALENLQIPSGFSLNRTITPFLLPGEEDFFELVLDASSPGSISGTVEFDHNGTNHPSPFRFTASGTVQSGGNPEPLIRVMHGTVATIPYDSTFAMGSTIPNDPIAVSIRVYNDGDATLVTNGVSVPPGYSVGDPLNSSIGPGSSDNFGLRLNATSPGTFTGLVEIHHSAPNWSSPYRFTVTGVVQGVGNPEPVLRITDTSGATIPHNGALSMGSTTQGVPLRRTLRAHNDGTADLAIGGINVPLGYSLADPLDSVIPPASSDTFEIVLTASSSGSFPGVIQIHHNAPDQPDPFRINVTGEVDSGQTQVAILKVLRGTTPIPYNSVLDLGTTEIGEPLSTTLIASNEGTAPLNISSLAVPPGYSIGEGLDPTIPPGASDSFRIVFDAADSGVSSGTVHFLHDGINVFTPFVVNVTAEAGGVVIPPSPQIRVETESGELLPSGSTCPFGPTTQGNPVSKEIRILNSGGVPVHISGVTLPPGYEIEEPIHPVIDPGQNDTFRVALTATSEGDFNGWIEIHHDATNELSPYRLFAEGTVLPPSNPASAPRIDSLSPRKVYVGTTVTMVLTGENFDESTVRIPESMIVGAIRPTILSSTISNGGRRLTVVVDATDPGTEESWALAVQNTDGVDGRDFRVVRHGPIVDAFTPSEPIAGGAAALFLIGANLEGATLSCTHPGIHITSVDSSADDAVSGVLRIDEGVLPGAATLLVTTPGGSTETLDLEIVPTEALFHSQYRQLRQSPTVYSQEMTVRGTPKETKSPEKKSMRRSCFFSYRRTVFSRRFVLNINLLDALGSGDPSVLDNLTPGEVRRFGVLTIIVAASLQISISFDFCHFDSFELCVSGSVGVEIPGITGYVETFTFCAGFGGFFPQFTFGYLTGFGLQSDCTTITPITGLPDGGEQYADIQIPAGRCCPQETPLLMNIAGRSFPGTPLEATYNFPTIPLVDLGSDSCLSFEIEVVEFIPTEFILPPVIYPLVHPFLIMVGKGDDRPCEYGASTYRAKQVIVIEMADSGPSIVGTPFKHVTRSDVCVLTPSGYRPFAAWENSDDEIEDPELHVVDEKSFNLIVNGQARSRLSPFPYIDWCYTILVDTNGPEPFYSILGGHDNYPAYEVYINGQLVHCWMPSGGATGFDLIGGCSDVRVDEQGTLGGR